MSKEHNLEYGEYLAVEEEYFFDVFGIWIPLDEEDEECCCEEDEEYYDIIRETLIDFYSEMNPYALPSKCEEIVDLYLEGQLD